MGYPKKIIASNTYDPNFGPLRAVTEQPFDTFNYERLLLENDPYALALKKITSFSQTEALASYIPYTPAEGYVITSANSVEYNHTISIPFSLERVEAVLIGMAVANSLGTIPKMTTFRAAVSPTLGSFETVRPFVIAFADYRKTFAQVGDDLSANSGFDYVKQATYADFFGKHGLDRMLPQYTGIGDRNNAFPLQDAGENTYSSLRAVWIDKEQNALIFRYKKVAGTGATIASNLEFPVIPIF